MKEPKNRPTKQKPKKKYSTKVSSRLLDRSTKNMKGAWAITEIK
jgi:hypothetical protein